MRKCTNSWAQSRISLQCSIGPLTILAKAPGVAESWPQATQLLIFLHSGKWHDGSSLSHSILRDHFLAVYPGGGPTRDDPIPSCPHAPVVPLCDYSCGTPTSIHAYTRSGSRHISAALTALRAKCAGTDSRINERSRAHYR